MVQPINYAMNVLNPIEGYMQGLKFGEDILSARQGRAATEQDMRIQQATFEEQQRARAEQRAAAQRAMEAANQGQAALMEYYGKLEAGTATPNDLRRAIVSFPGMAEQFQSVASSFSSERLANETRFGKQLSFSIARGNIEGARGLLDERVAAAEAAGDDQAAATYKSQLMMLDQDPNGLLMQSLMPLAATLPSDEFDQFYTGVLGLGQQDLPADYQNLRLRARDAGLVEGTPEFQEFMRSGGATLGENFRPATAEEAAQYGASAGQVDVTSGRFYPINPPTGMTVRTTPEGGVELVQGPGVGGDTGKRSADYIYGTDDQGRPVARPIEGTPAASEVQQNRGRLEASISVGEDMLRTIESVVGRPAGEGLTAIRPNEALEGILGLIEGNLPARTQAQADLLAKVDQISGRAFLEAFDTLKGGGQITEAEGRQATQALARLQRTQSPEAFQASLYEFADIVRRGILRSQNELAVLPEIAPASSATAPAAGGRIRYDAEGNRIE